MVAWVFYDGGLAHFGAYQAVPKPVWQLTALESK